MSLSIQPQVVGLATTPKLGGGNLAIGTAKMVTAPFDWVCVGAAALGKGAMPEWVQGAGGVHVLLSAYRNGSALFQKTDPASLNPKLKELNKGNDIAADDLKALAKKIDQRAKISGSVGLLSNAFTGAAIATGNAGYGVLAIAMKIASFGYTGGAVAATVKDELAVVAKQAKAPVPAPAPAPAPAQP